MTWLYYSEPNSYIFYCEQLLVEQLEAPFGYVLWSEFLVLFWTDRVDFYSYFSHMLETMPAITQYHHTDHNCLFWEISLYMSWPSEHGLRFVSICCMAACSSFQLSWIIRIIMNKKWYKFHFTVQSTETWIIHRFLSSASMIKCIWLYTFAKIKYIMLA